jgi:hypothetical protein
MTCTVPVKRRHLMCRLVFPVVGISLGMSIHAGRLFLAPLNRTAVASWTSYQHCHKIVAFQCKDGSIDMTSRVFSNDRDRSTTRIAPKAGGHDLGSQKYHTTAQHSLGHPGGQLKSRHSSGPSALVLIVTAIERLEKGRPRRHGRYTGRSEVQPEGHQSTQREAYYFSHR